MEGCDSGSWRVQAFQEQSIMKLKQVRDIIEEDVIFLGRE